MGSCRHRRRQREQGGGAGDAGAELQRQWVDGPRWLEAKGGEPADQAAAGGAALLEAALTCSGAGPDAGQLPANAQLADDLQQPGATAGGVVDQPGRQV
jgi:hypothetical protein